MREVLIGEFAELRDALAAALDGGPAVLPLAPGSGELRAAMAPEEPAEPGTAVIIATSGSTGEPKGVLLSADALRASATATHARLGGPGHWLLATPANYIGGLQVVVRSLLAGTECVALPAGRFDGERFAEAAKPVLRQEGPRYTALVPTQLTRILDAGGPGLDAARAFDAIIIGAAATSDALRERAADTGVSIVPAYGMSETSSGCVYDGVPLDGVEVRIGPDERVLIAGRVLTHGYRLRPDLTAAALVDGWFRTGDRGRLVGGRLEVLGRLDDVINTGGVKVSAAAVERALAACPGIRESCVVGVPDDEWGQAVAAAVVADGPVEIALLRDAVRDAAGAAAVPKRFEFVAALPLRGPGKIDRTAVLSAVFGAVG